MNNDIEKILFTESELKSIAESMGRQISADYCGKDLILLCIMKGSLVFTADLMRAITIPITLDFMQTSSYGSSSFSSGSIDIKYNPQEKIKNRHVLIVEDIIDSGNTLSRLKPFLENLGAADVKICALLDKPSRRIAEIKADYIGRRIPDEFVVGYGLDYAEKYRNLPYIGILKREIYQ
jgi:hypoxanthine phosphoribosyltransferase